MVGSLSAGSDLVNVGLPGALVYRGEKGVDLRFFGQPCSHTTELLAQAVDGLMVHVRLRNKFRHGD